MPNRLNYLSAPLLHRWVSRLILFPSTHPIELANHVQRDLKFDDAVLSVVIARSPGCAFDDPAVFHLEFSGNGSRAERFGSRAAARWGDRAVEVWALNYPGYGSSTGPASLRALPESALAAYDILANQAAGRPIVVGGHSLGCAVALHVAACRPVAGVLLANPPPLKQLIVGHYGWWNAWLGAAVLLPQLPAELDSVANAKRSTAPVLIFSSENDRVVPPRFHRRIYDDYAGPKMLVPLPGAMHNQFPDLEEPANKAAFDWLWKQCVSFVH